MWLRASYTVENAVITPLFMLIIIVVMRASCDIHDNLIQRSVNSQFVIQTELGGFNDEDTDMYRIKTEEYLKRRVIFYEKIQNRTRSINCKNEFSRKNYKNSQCT